MPLGITPRLGVLPATKPRTEAQGEQEEDDEQAQDAGIDGFDGRDGRRWMLAASPSASAAPLTCTKIHQQAVIYRNVWELLSATGYGSTRTAAAVDARADAYETAYRKCLA